MHLISKIPITKFIIQETIYNLDLNFQKLISSLTHSLTGSLAVLAISTLFLVRFGQSLRVYYLEFDKETVLMVTRAKPLVSVLGGFEF